MPARHPAAAWLETDSRPGLPFVPGRERLSLNAMAHAGARHVEIELRLDLAVADDGQVEWPEAEPAGIRCRMAVQPF